MTRLVQIQNGQTRAVALVDEPHLRLLAGVGSIYQLVTFAEASKNPLLKIIEEQVIAKEFDYDEIYSGQSDWKLLSPIDHAVEPSRCLVSGTGLTHLGSAKNR